jgi:hypothetical protein
MVVVFAAATGEDGGDVAGRADGVDGGLASVDGVIDDLLPMRVVRIDRGETTDHHQNLPANHTISRATRPSTAARAS